MSRYERYEDPNRDWDRTERPHPKPRNYEVKDRDGGVHVVEAHFMFDNGPEGLVLRRYPTKDAEKTEIVFRAPANGYVYVKEV